MQRLCFILSLVIFSCHVHSQDFSGSFSGRSDAGLATLVLKNSASGTYSGTLDRAGMVLALKGKMRHNILSGTIGDGSDGGSISMLAVQKG